MTIRTHLRKYPAIVALYERLTGKSMSEQEFRKQFDAFKRLSVVTRFPVRWEDRYPCMNDRTVTTEYDHHYIHHLAWAARVLAKTKPEQHTDISSSLYFSTMMSAFFPVHYYDFRPAVIRLDNLTSDRADLTALPFDNESIPSLSCMHTVEHIGLGRYGDPLDPDGDLKAIMELNRVLAPDGNLLFVVPVGKPRVQFNAHRIYSYEQIDTYFDDLHLINFTLIPDNAITHPILTDPSPMDVARQEYGCGCFWYRKERC
jgi:SAM-dependent methyltransferase